MSTAAAAAKRPESTHPTSAGAPGTRISTAAPGSRAHGPLHPLFGGSGRRAVRGSIVDSPEGSAKDQSYETGCYLARLDDKAIDVMVEHADNAPSPMSVIGLEHMLSGAVARIPSDDTAFGNRDAVYNLLILGMYEDRDLDAAMRRWVRGFSAAMQPHATGGVYVNYMSHDEADRVGAAYGSRHYERLAALKKKYDPDNLFRLNQNIAPAVT